MRLADKGLIDRSKLVTFTFDGRSYVGFAGDSLASALLAMARMHHTNKYCSLQFRRE